MLDNLVFDRLRRDVELALERAGSAEFQKGAYNYTDLNRVESWCKYLQELLNDYAKNINIDIKLDWNLRDYPFRIQIDRIRDNINTLRNACYAIMSLEIIEYNNTLNYEQANILEKILYDIDKYIIEMTQTVNLPYKVGTKLIIVQNEELTINTDIMLENRNVPLEGNIGSFIFSRKYTKMEVL